MSKIVIYHGSDKIVKKPSLEKGKKHNDFGQGFYCTKIIERGKEWACRDSIFGYLNKYELDINGLKILDLTKLECSSLVWITLLIKYRTFEKNGEMVEIFNRLEEIFGINLDDYDVVIGYRADDSYFSFARRFLNNSLPIQSLNYVLRLGTLGLQIVLKSEKAFKHIKYVSCEYVEEKYHDLFVERDHEAKTKFIEYIKTRGLNDDDLFVRDIVKKGFDLNDPRIR